MSGAPSRGQGAQAPDAADPDAGAVRRGERAARLAGLGEVSAAPRALTAQPLAPGTLETLQELRDPARPSLARPVPPDAQAFQPRSPLVLNSARLVSNPRSAQRGAAPGLSGATAEHYCILLDDEESTSLFQRAAQDLARADVPAAILEGLRLGRVVALQKPNGRLRGLVMGHGRCAAPAR